MIKKISIVLVLVFSIFSSSLIVAKADTVPTISGIYEPYIPFPATSPNAYGVTGIISINFDDYVSGTLTCNINCEDVLLLNFNNYVEFYCIGAEAKVVNNETQIKFYIEDEKTILFYYHSAYVGTGTNAMIGLVTLSYKSKSLDIISHVDATDVNQISGQMATLLSTMNNIYNQDATILTRLTTLNTKTDTIISNLGTIVTALNTLQTSINSIDTQIDTISWNTFASGLLGFTDDLSTYTTNTGSHSEQYMIFNEPSPDSWTKNAPCIYRITAPIGNRVITQINFYALYNNALRSFSPEYYYFNNRNSIEIYIIYDSYLENPTQKMNLVLEFITTQGNIYNYGTSVSPFAISYIPSTDIEYWSLLQYFHSYDYQKSQLELTQELIDIVSQLSSGNSTETTTNITNFNTNMEIINNIETDLQTQFNAQSFLFKHNSQGDWVFDNDIQNQVSALNSVFNSFVTNFYPARNWLSIILLCAVVLALLG